MAFNERQLPGSSLEAEKSSPPRGVLMGTSRMVPSIPPGEMSSQRPAMVRHRPRSAPPAPLLAARMDYLPAAVNRLESLTYAKTP